MKLLADLFLTFARIGLFTFGGGYAMLALIEDLCVERKKWITHDQMMDITVIAESTPGPIAINCATFTGFKMAGLTGALAATLGMILPSFCVIYGISLFLEGFMELPLVAGAFRGIRVAVGVLILDAALTMLKKMKSKKPLPRVILILSCAALLAASLFARHLSSITLMLLAAAVSLTAFFLGSRKGGEGK